MCKIDSNASLIFGCIASKFEEVTKKKRTVFTRHLRSQVCVFLLMNPFKLYLIDLKHFFFLNRLNFGYFTHYQVNTWWTFVTYSLVFKVKSNGKLINLWRCPAQSVGSRWDTKGRKSELDIFKILLLTNSHRRSFRALLIWDIIEVIYYAKYLVATTTTTSQ